MFGKKETQYGVRTGSDVVWFETKSKCDNALSNMKKAAKRKGTTEPKVVKRQVKVEPKNKVVAKVKGKVTRNDPCKGGSCKRNNYCTKHAKEISGSEWSLYDAAGRNKNTLRWDEK